MYSHNKYISNAVCLYMLKCHNVKHSYTLVSQVTKAPPAKKKKKGPKWPPQGSGVSGRFIHLTQLPVDATLQEVADLVGTFGKNTINLMAPSSEEKGRAPTERKVLGTSSFAQLKASVQQKQFSEITSIVISFHKVVTGLSVQTITNKTIIKISVNKTSPEIYNYLNI